MKKVLDAAKGIEKKVGGTIDRHKKSAFERFPLLFTGLGTFGVVATLYGFEGIIDNIDWLADKPWAILLVGIATLIFTGSLYDKLQ